MRYKLTSDLKLVLQRNPGLSIYYCNNEPKFLFGKYEIHNLNGEIQDFYEIRIYFDANKYPYCFPILQEISNKIQPKCEDRHIDKNGFACVEIRERIPLISKNGITIIEFIKNYVHKYFCWQILFDLNEFEALTEWPHFAPGTLEIYQNLLSLVSIDHIISILSDFVQDKLLVEDKLCACQNGKLFQNCHGNQNKKIIETLKTIGKEIILLGIKDLLKLKTQNPYIL